MKNKKINLLAILSMMSLVGCELTPVTPTTNSTSLNTSSFVSTNTNISSSSSKEENDDPFNAVSIKSVREESNTGDIVTIRGVVVKHNYTGQSTPYITGCWIADKTGSIYIYGEDVSKSVKEGNEVVIKGEKAFYIPQNDTGAAASMNYTGMVQLKNVELLNNDNLTNEIPAEAIQETTVSELNKIPLSTNITGNIYKVKGRYSKHTPADYTNYYIYDLNRVDSMQAYTQSNGKDYAWTDSYDQKTVEMLIIVSIGKPGIDDWKFCPVSFLNDDVKVSAEEEVNYALDRVLAKFSDEINVDTTVEVAKEEENLSGSVVKVESTSSSVTVNEEADKYNVSISAASLGKATVKATVTYDNVTLSKEKEITITKKADYETVTLKEAREKVGEEVIIEAIVGKVTYKSGMTKQGLFLVDETSSLFAYFSTSLMAQLENVEEGNKVTIKGSVVHYLDSSKTDAATQLGFSGNIQFADGEILNVDTNVYNVPETCYLDSTITDLVNTAPSTNITSNVYKVTTKVSKSISTYATTYNLLEVGNESVKLNVYSQVSGADFTWLDKYDGQEVTMLVGIQNLKYSSSSHNWRVCPIQVL